MRESFEKETGSIKDFSPNLTWKIIKEKGTGNVPLHLRNAPTELMKNLDYGKNYKYPHSYPDGFVKENYFPEELNENPKFYNPKELGREKFLKEQLAYLKSIDY